MLKLYTVTIESEVVVLANNEAEAEELAQEELFTIGGIDKDQFDTAASPMTHLPGGWGANAIPYGQHLDNDPDRTIKQWIDQGAAPHYNVVETILIIVNGEKRGIHQTRIDGWEHIPEVITELAKKQGWGPEHQEYLRKSVAEDPVCPVRLRAYVERAPVGLSPRNIDCPLHGPGKCSLSRFHVVTYQEIVALVTKYSRGEARCVPPMLSVTYRHGPDENREGILAPGEKVRICEGMVFNAFDTSRA